MKQYTVSVGIPAYNEEKNIRRIVESVQKQQQNTYLLESVIVFSDCSTDKTDQIIKHLKKLHNNIDFDVNESRMGKSATMNRIIQRNTSDLLLFLDADVDLANNNVIENLVQTHSHTHADLVGGLDVPVLPKSFFEHITTAWIHIWDRAKFDKRNRYELFKLSARIMMLSRKFADATTIPDTILADDQYLYILAQLEKRKIDFSDRAKVYYRIPDNITDYLKQSARYLLLMNNASSHFVSNTDKYFEMSEQAKKDALIYEFKNNPGYTVLGILLQLVLRVLLPFMRNTHSARMWSINTSTKRIYNHG